MNAIHQISLKLQMGIHPATQISPEMLRAMWFELLCERYDAVQQKAGKYQRPAPAGSLRPSLRQVG